MYKYCSDCKNIDKKKKANGNTSGALYFCKKNKCFVNTSLLGCDNYAKSDRKRSENDKIYEDGKNYDNDNLSIGTVAFILITITILWILSMIL